MRAVSVLVCILGLVISAQTFGQTTGWHVATVTKVLIDERNAGDSAYPLAQSYGGCAARVTPNPRGSVPGCTSAYISLGCDGTIVAKSSAQNNLSSAQLALVTGEQISFWLDSNMKQSGACIAVSTIVE